MARVEQMFDGHNGEAIARVIPQCVPHGDHLVVSTMDGVLTLVRGDLVRRDEDGVVTVEFRAQW